MWVKLHGVAHDIGYLVVPAVIHALHGVEYASLYWLEAIHYVRHGSLQYDVRGIFEEPVLVHFVKVMGNAILHSNVVSHYYILCCKI